MKVAHAISFIRDLLLERKPRHDLAIARLNRQPRIADRAESRWSRITSRAAERAGRNVHTVRQTRGRSRDVAATRALRIARASAVDLQLVLDNEKLCPEFQRLPFSDGELAANIDRFRRTSLTPEIAVERRRSAPLAQSGIRPGSRIQRELLGWVYAMAVWILQVDRLPGHAVLQRVLPIPIAMGVGG